MRSAAVIVVRASMVWVGRRVQADALLAAALAKLVFRMEVALVALVMDVAIVDQGRLHRQHHQAQAPAHPVARPKLQFQLLN